MTLGSETQARRDRRWKSRSHPVTLFMRPPPGRSPALRTWKQGQKQGHKQGQHRACARLGKGRWNNPLLASLGVVQPARPLTSAEEKLKDFAWRIAKAFPAKRGGVPQASAALTTFIADGHASREEIEAGLRAWAPYFEACFRENGHHTGTTLAGWLEAQHFRFDPRDVHDWTPEDDESSELFS